MTHETEPMKELPILQAHDVLEVNVVAEAEGGERLIAAQIPRLRVGFAMSIQDALLFAKALAQACTTAAAMNDQDAEASAPQIIVPTSH